MVSVQRQGRLNGAFDFDPCGGMSHTLAHNSDRLEEVRRRVRGSTLPPHATTIETNLLGARAVFVSSSCAAPRWR